MEDAKIMAAFNKDYPRPQGALLGDQAVMKALIRLQKDKKPR